MAVVLVGGILPETPTGTQTKSAFAVEEDVSLPFRYDAENFAKGFKAILDKTKVFRAKLKPFGDLVADTILATLKTLDRIFSADDLDRIDADLCKELAEAANKVDTSDLLDPDQAGRSAKKLAKKLDDFRRRASDVFASGILRMNDSKLMTTLKQNLLMNLALTRDGADTESLADDIEDHYEALVTRYGQQELLDAIGPALESADE